MLDNYRMPLPHSLPATPNYNIVEIHMYCHTLPKIQSVQRSSERDKRHNYNAKYCHTQSL
jgi:hypothetical protein